MIRAIILSGKFPIEFSWPSIYLNEIPSIDKVRIKTMIPIIDANSLCKYIHSYISLAMSVSISFRHVFSAWMMSSVLALFLFSRTALQAESSLINAFSVAGKFQPTFLPPFVECQYEMEVGDFIEEFFLSFYFTLPNFLKNIFVGGVFFFV